jgi:P27 family predicted phage terminase small subunit
MGSRGPLPDAGSKRAVRRKREAAKEQPVDVPPERALVPDPPAYLGAVALAVWERVWREPQVLEGDYTSVERLCLLESDALRLRSIVAREGEILSRPIQSARGEVVGAERYAHPALVELRRIGKEAADLCRELGLTPAARARLGLTVVAPEMVPDAIDELKARRARRLGLPEPVVGADRL